ncbi:MAG: proteasome subunit alpha [Nitrospirae bacterium]|nr:proteasome subunit alpha [Nitrospirota bacterium]
MPLPYYVSPEQMMQDKAEYAQKGISKGRSTIVMEYEDGILFFADNPSASLNKISEVYDRIAFAGAGKYSEFESLRKAGIRHADLKGYAYSRDDVSAKSLANAYSQSMGTMFSQEIKPLEVEILVAEVHDGSGANEIYRILYDGNICDEKGYAVIGGKSEAVKVFLKDKYRAGMNLKESLKLSVEALESTVKTKLEKENMEVAVLDRGRNGRKFRRIKIDELITLLS